MSTMVSIILCSHNRAEHLEKTLQSLRDVEVPTDWTTELLLVDNASTDGTPEVMRAFEHSEMPVHVVREENQGLSHARNRGVDEAQGRVLLFTDDDVRFPSGWIQGMARPILNGPADAVAGGVELAEEVRKDWMTARHRELLASTERIDPEHPDRVVGANMAIGRHVFDKVPRFDPELGPGQLGLGGETLFSYQMQEAGFRIETAFNVAIRHHPDRSRLSRESWMDAARKSGRAGAYISYHWEHRRHSLPALYAGWMYYICLLYWKKSIGWKSNNENICIQEISLRRKIERIKKHLKENGKKSKYNKK
jgi:glycosyltransferase involved in cell wall biosynthesis